MATLRDGGVSGYDDVGVVLANKVTRRVAAGIFAIAGGLAAWWWGYLLSYILNGQGGTARYVGSAVLGAFVLLVLVCAVGALRMRVTVRSDGVHIRNLLTSRSIPWPRVSGFAGEPRSTRAGTWWSLLVLLRDSERVVKLGALYTRDAGHARAAEDRLRSLAPAGTSADERLGERRPPPVAPAPPTPPAGSRPRYRYVTRSWGYTTGGGIIGLCAWGVLASLAVLGGLALILGPSGSAAGGVVTIVITGILTAVVVQWCRPRTVVTAGGVRARRSRKVVPWVDISAITVVETVNEMMTARRSYLSLDTHKGPVPLWGTLRPPRQIASVYARVAAFRPLRDLS